jgi:hypothetical protein
MATYHYTTINSFAIQTHYTNDLAIDRCLSRVKKTCKAVVAHTLEIQVARIRATQKQVALELEITQGAPSGLWGWLAKRKKIQALKAKLANLKEALVKWVCSVYEYFVA